MAQPETFPACRWAHPCFRPQKDWGGIGGRRSSPWRQSTIHPSWPSIGERGSGSLARLSTSPAGGSCSRCGGLCLRLLEELPRVASVPWQGPRAFGESGLEPPNLDRLADERVFSQQSLHKRRDGLVAGRAQGHEGTVKFWRKAHTAADGSHTIVIPYS